LLGFGRRWVRVHWDAKGVKGKRGLPAKGQATEEPESKRKRRKENVTSGSMRNTASEPKRTLALVEGDDP